MQWWTWIILGLVLVVAELLTPGGFFIIFFGASALIVGAMSSLRIAGPQWLQWILFAAVAIVALLLFRKPLLAHFSGSTAKSDQIGDLKGSIVVLTQGLGPGEVGKAEMQGTSWGVKNVGTVPLMQGQRCIVTQVDGITLFITQETNN